MKNILILGGTNVIGRCLVEKLRSSDSYKLYLYNRGKTNPQLFNNVDNIINIVGDRNSEEDIKQLKSIKWNYIIDLSCFRPKSIQLVLEAINTSKIEKYILISTVSVYDLKTIGILSEDSDLKKFEAKNNNDEDYSPSYGERKAECEQILIKSNIAYSILRLANIYGENSYSDKLYFWLYACYTQRELYVPQNYTNKNAYIYLPDLIDVIITSMKFNDSIICNTIADYISIKEIIDIYNENLKQNLILNFVSDKELASYNIFNEKDRFSNEKFIKTFGRTKLVKNKKIKNTILFFNKTKYKIPEHFKIYENICSQILKKK